MISYAVEIIKNIENFPWCLVNKSFIIREAVFSDIINFMKKGFP